MKTFTLDVEDECDFALFGLVSSTRDYTLAWTLNRALRLRLVRQPELLLSLLSQGRLVGVIYCDLTGCFGRFEPEDLDVRGARARPAATASGDSDPSTVSDEVAARIERELDE